MSGAMKAAALVAAAFALLPSPIAAQTRPGGTIGYSAAERRAVDARLVRMEAAHGALASRLGLSRQLVRAIAAEVGLANSRFTDAQLIAAVEGMAARAVEIQRENNRLREEVARLRDPSLRDPALALLAQAEAALEAGQLAEAEMLYGQIRTLRWDESRAAEEAWTAALEAEARTAELRQDFRGAARIRLEASDRLLARSEADHRRAFEQANAAARGHLYEGEVFDRPEAFEAALAIARDRVLPLVSRERYPELWAMATTNIGVILSAMGDRSVGQARQNLLRQSVVAYRSALEVSTRETDPTQWAAINNNLANSLVALRGGEDEGVLLAQAETAIRASLTVYRREDSPDQWATSMNNLGNVLQARGGFTGGRSGVPLLVQAIDVYRQALTVRTREAMPFEWAATQHNLGSALFTLADQSGPELGDPFLVEATEASEAALTVRTREQLPALWASTQINLAAVLQRRGERSDGSVALQLLSQSETAYRSALSVFTESETSGYWVKAQTGLALTLTMLGERIGGERGLTLVRQGADAYQSALRALSSEHTPRLWATTHEKLGNALEVMGMFSQAPERLTYWHDAERCYQVALQTFHGMGDQEAVGFVTQSLARIQARIAAER